MAFEDSKSKELLIVTLLLLSWTTLFVACRYWAKWSQNKWQWADAAVFGSAYVVGVVQCTTIFVATTKYGLGYEAPKPANEANLSKLLYASALLYVACVGLTRCSAALFLSSLSPDRRQKMAGTVLVGASAIWTVGGIIAIAVRGEISAPWETPKPFFTRWLAVEIIAIIIELSLWISSFVLVWSLNMPVFRRLKVVSIFATRLISVLFILLRVLRLRPSVYHGTIDDITMFNVCTEVVMLFSVIAECLTCLKPIMQTFYEDFAVDSRSQYWGGLELPHSSDAGGSKGSKSGVVMWSKEAPTWKRSNSRHKVGDDIELRTDLNGGFSTKIEGRKKDRGPRPEDDMELLPTSNIRVEKSTTMSVS